MMMLRHCIAPTVLTLVAGTACADWTGSGQLGYVSATGNTESQSANAKVDLKSESEIWKHAFVFSALYGRKDEVESANRWETAWQSDYNLTQKSYWFGGLRYEDDRYGAYSYQATATTGLGYRFLDSETIKLNAQLGIGYKRSEGQTLIEDENDEVIDRIYEDPTNRAVVAGTVDYEHQLTDNTKLLNKFLVESASDNTFMQNNLALQVSMNAHLALSVGYEVRKNTSPPPEQHSVDTLTTLNLVYKIE